MKSWQWIAVPLCLALLAVVVCFPFAYFQYPDKAEIASTRVSESYSYGFVPIWTVQELLNAPFAVVKWPVMVLLSLSVASLCAFIFGYRPRSFPGRSKILAQAWGGFACIALAAGAGAKMGILGYSPKLLLGAIFLIGCAVAFLWSSVSSASFGEDRDVT